MESLLLLDWSCRSCKIRFPKMVSVFCISSLFPRGWFTTSSSEEPLVIKPSTVALNIPLVVHKILYDMSCSELRRLRLVSRTWNNEAVGHLQKRGRQVTYLVPYQYHHRTRELVELFDRAMVLEDDLNLIWRWPYTNIYLDKVVFQKPTFGNVEYILRKISLHAKDLKIGGGLKLQDFPAESSDLFFPCLTQIVFEGSGDVRLVEWIIKRSPKLHHLNIIDDRAVTTKIDNNHLEQLFTKNYVTLKDLNIFVSFLTKVKSSLRTLSIDVTLRNSRIVSDIVSADINFVNLAALKIHTFLAAALISCPKSLQRLKSLELILDESDPQILLSQWIRNPINSVEKLSLGRGPGLRFKDFVPSRVVHEIAQIFPNIKILRIRLPLSEYPESIAFDSWVPALKHLEEFYVEICGIWQFGVAIPNPLSTFAGLRVLTLVYTDGYIRDAHCQSVFLQMSKLERLRFISENDEGKRISVATLAKMQNRFVVTWETLTAHTWTKD